MHLVNRSPWSPRHGSWGQNNKAHASASDSNGDSDEEFGEESIRLQTPNKEETGTEGSTGTGDVVDAEAGGSPESKLIGPPKDESPP